MNRAQMSIHSLIRRVIRRDRLQGGTVPADSGVRGKSGLAGGVASIFARLDAAGSLRLRRSDGCTAKEIAAVRSHFAHDLPPEYQQFLRRAGRGAGKLFQGSAIYYPELLELQQAAKELLIENGGTLSLPEGAMVFFMHQGYEFCFLQPTTADPPVFQYVEGQDGFANPWDRFSGFLEDAVADHLRAWPNLNSSVGANP